MGSGAYAKVKSAHALKMNKQVAIKIIHTKTGNNDLVTKFLPRELEALRAVDHENVIKLFDVIETEDLICMVMELAEGGDLLDFINARRYLTEYTAREFFKDLASGVSMCHSVNVVHRDLKCENLLLDSKLRLKISDFGFARKHEGKLLETYCGSYAYAAPEIILGEPYIGEPADIWSMGVVLYAMVAGRLPFKDNDVKTLLNEIAKHIVFPEWISDECKDLIRKILTFSVKDRITIEGIRKHPWMSLEIGKDSREAEMKALLPAPPRAPRTHASQTAQKGKDARKAEKEKQQKEKKLREKTEKEELEKEKVKLKNEPQNKKEEKTGKQQEEAKTPPEPQPPTEAKTPTETKN